MGPLETSSARYQWANQCWVSWSDGWFVRPGGTHCSIPGMLQGRIGHLYPIKFRRTILLITRDTTSRSPGECKNGYTRLPTLEQLTVRTLRSILSVLNTSALENMPRFVFLFHGAFLFLRHRPENVLLLIACRLGCVVLSVGVCETSRLTIERIDYGRSTRYCC